MGGEFNVEAAAREAQDPLSWAAVTESHSLKVGRDTAMWALTLAISFVVGCLLMAVFIVWGIGSKQDSLACAYVHELDELSRAMADIRTFSELPLLRQSDLRM